MQAGHRQDHCYMQAGSLCVTCVRVILSVSKPKHAPQNVLRAYLDFVFNCTLVLHFTHKFFHTAKACVYGAHSKSCPAHRIRFPFYLQDEVPEFLCTCLKVSNWIAYHADKPVLS